MKKLLSVLSVFALAAIAAGTASAGSISTPTGLNPGEQFRIVFLSSTSTSASSGDLSIYDSIVSADATGTTYGGTSPIWKAIVSNSTTKARDHIGLQNSSTIPLFTVDGTKVSAGNLWSGSLLNPINITIGGSVVSTKVWTGTNIDGGKQTYMGMFDIPIGSNSPSYGESNQANNLWTYVGFDAPSVLYRVYGISDVLTVPASVPEPSTAMLVGLGGLAALGYSFKRKRA